MDLNASRNREDHSSKPPSRRFRPTKKTAVITAAVLLLIVVVFIIIGLFRRPAEPTPRSTAEHPNYQTILPEGKTIDQLGGWQRVSPPNSTPVFAYLDTVSGVDVSVSEQPLPKSLSSGSDDQVASLAEAYNATDKLTAGDTTVYVGTSAKGPQSVILTKNDLLILIKSQKKVSDDAWKSYVESLR